MIVGTKDTDPTICQTSLRTIVDAVSALNPTTRPFLAVISSTGVSNSPNDVPLALYPLYKIVLRTPHQDKRVMEEELVRASAENRIGGFAIVRPTLMTNGKLLGTDKVRAGTEKKPAVGYTISREDVGNWIFEQLVQGNRSEWNGEKISVTY